MVSTASHSKSDVCFDYVYLNGAQVMEFPVPMEGVGSFLGRQARYCFDYERVDVLYKLNGDRADKYNNLIVEHSTESGMDHKLVASVIQIESNFVETAVSNKGAMGLMQLMPITALRYGVKDPFDPEQNIKGGIALLKELQERYGDLELVLAAYNAGERAVDKYGGIPPYKETQNYVSKVLAVYYGQ